VAAAVVVPLLSVTVEGATEQITWAFVGTDPQVRATAPLNPVVELTTKLDTVGWLATAVSAFGLAETV
jgi:hypothetical protein